MIDQQVDYVLNYSKKLGSRICLHQSNWFGLKYEAEYGDASWWAKVDR